MTPPVAPRPDHPLEPTTAAKTTSTQLFGVLYITLTGLVDSMVPNSGPWSLLGQSISYIIKLAPILWWALPAGLAAPHPETPNASTYDWIPDTSYVKLYSYSSGKGVAIVKSLLPLALDRTTFSRCTKKSAQKPAKPLDSLEDLAHIVDEQFLLACPSQVENVDVWNYVPTWEETLINLDYFLAWACLHLKLIKSKQSGRATA
ncbi:hypothetical protein DSO57_1032179 [Entomophthora muscae]|uniref:Uncharacterized protein n=1 Tax=Entomophthora muscae TaxID=34485 RepID=A0ACC2UAV7_9FUNG|nr:hypothetical protein DSO57_1032179 [Entomophthora muscae]